ncbi:ROK family protein [Marivivens donghaensis]|uniref:N-acetylglucosamine kinase n=1 Tax=Marivivens donghaensis TaxID=1699413 RepID=A0ABX0VTG6_9RHOB|nr:ROK family protein [Marivivens donghaensis]NIY71279.1 ROK family protein [Marivivens donghaensis]
MICGGIDLGGTKIEARFFDGPDTATIEKRRVPTPLFSFDEMIDALVDQIEWLRAQGGNDLPIGVCVPGVIDRETGICYASNIPSTGHSIEAAVKARIGVAIPVINDCMAFAFSEAMNGAGQGEASVMGLILGTGVGGGYVLNGELPYRENGLAVEIGHVGMPLRAATRHNLPVFTCGCGKVACMENYMSGTGFANIAQHVTGQRIGAHELHVVDTNLAERLLNIWTDIVAECLYTIQVMLDPGCIVLGGGASQIPNLTDRLEVALERHRLGHVAAPQVRLALHGDSSGARGAGLAALEFAGAK